MSPDAAGTGGVSMNEIPILNVGAYTNGTHPGVFGRQSIISPTPFWLVEWGYLPLGKQICPENGLGRRVLCQPKGQPRSVTDPFLLHWKMENVIRVLGRSRRRRT